ncbi:MAG: Ig-like domain-containing protein, partial [Bacteroidota bacterium]
MRRFKSISPSLIAIFGLAALLYSCANIVKPSGGDKDSDGPVIIGAIPSPGMTNFYSDEIVFYFDEFLKPGNYKDEIFISPVQETNAEVTVKNKRLRIRFKEPFLDSTTYVVTLNTGIKDFNEGNKMEEAFTYAFSTGDRLDSMEIKGKITNPWTGAGESGMVVMLFPAETIIENDIWERRPMYAIESDETGEFKFQYLAEDTYKIYAVRDQDRNYMYNSPQEAVAIPDFPRVDLGDTNQRKKEIELFAFREDNEPPGVKSLRWINDFTIQVEFTEGIRDTFDDTHLQMVLSDTMRKDPRRIQHFRFSDKRKKYLWIDALESRKDFVTLDLKYIM